MQPITVVVAMIAWTVIAVIIAAAARRGMGQGASEFFLGGRRIGGFVSGMTYAATTYSAFMLVGLVGLTYRSGVGALGFEMTYLIFTVLFLIVFGPRFWLVGKRHGHITPPELLGFRYESKWVSFVAAIISFVMLIPYSAVQLIGSGLLVSGLTGGQVPFMVGVLVMAVLAGVTALWAGMRSVSWTDAFQAITMIVTSVIAVVFVAFQFFDAPAGLFSAVEANQPELLEFTWSPALFFGLTLPWAFFALTNPQVSQRLFIPDRLRSMRRMIIYFAVFGFLYTIISTLFGFAATQIVPGLENPDAAMPELLARLPVALAVILFIGIFAAASSTLGSIILTLSSLFTRDVVKVIKPDISEKSERVIAQVAMVILLALCVGFASLQLGLIAVLSSMASGGLWVMAPAIIGAFFWKRATTPAALWSMAIGAVVTGILYLTGFYPLGWWPSVWGAGLTTILFVCISLVTAPPPGGAKFIESLEQELVDRKLR
ncbi:MAG: sodium:solute symporter family protein [Spirochaetota bacterium]